MNLESNQVSMCFDNHVYTGHFSKFKNSKEQQAIYKYLLLNPDGVTTLQIDNHLRSQGLFVMGGVKTVISEMRANGIRVSCESAGKNDNGKRISIWKLI